MRARADRLQAGERRKALGWLDAIAETVHVLDLTPRLSAFLTAVSSGVAHMSTTVNLDVLTSVVVPGLAADVVASSSGVAA